MALASDAAASRAAPDTAPGGGAPAGIPQAPEELIEAQLRGILEATTTVAGAVCLFDQHQELLRLAVEVGLSDEGCRRLRNIRRGSATTWDMPLHSLLNRRAYLIESAAKNRYVPPLVDDVAAVRSVACIPLYDGATAVGSLILVSKTSFGERQVRLLEQPVRDLVAGIGAMRKRATTAAPAASTRPSLASRAGGSAPPPAAVTAAGPIAPGVKVAPGSAPVTGSSVHAAVERARAELERLRARVAEAEEAASRERVRAATAEQQLAEREAELEQLRAAMAERTAEQQTFSDQLRDLEQALASAQATEAALREELGQTGAAERDRLTAEQSAAMAALTSRLAEAEAERDRLRARIGEVEHSGLSAVTDAETRASQALAAAEAQTVAATAEIERLRAHTTALEAAHEAALAEAAAAEQRATATLEDVAAWKARCEAIEAELETTRSSLATRGDETDAIVRERSEIDRELAEARERASALEARLAEAQQIFDRLTNEDSQFRDGFAHLESLIQTGVESGDVPTNPERPAFDLSQAGAFEVVDLDGDGALPDDLASFASDGPGLDIEEVGAAEPAAAPVARPAPTAAPAAAPEGIVVVDVDAAWATAASGGIAVTAVSPEGDPAAEVAARNPERLVLNLAAPNALAALVAIRAAGLTTPCFGCLGVAGRPQAVLLGRIELATRPIDPDALVSLLEGVFVRGTRVVTAGADVDGLISVRQALGRLGASVSMAWDTKQANDLLGMVRPDVAIVDLELPPRDGCGVVARLAAAGHVPVIVLVPKAADCARAFAAAVAEPDVAKAAVPYADLLTTVTTRPLRKAPAAPPLRR